MMDNPKYIVSFDSLKGCLSSADANQAAAEMLQQLHPHAEIVQLTASDGGEGWIDAFADAWNCERVQVTVHDALMRRVESSYLMKGDLAIIEIAQSCGLMQIPTAQRNPMRATSYGVGEQLVDAIRHGCRRFIVGLGGSATSDAGIGMLRALMDGLATPSHRTVDASGWCNHSFDDLTELRDCHFVIGTDVTNVLCGPHGAAAIFGPQKGATPEMVKCLDARAAKFARVSARHFGKDVSLQPGSGAAGGLGYAFMQYLGATCQSGAKLLLDTVDFPKKIQHATCVITGEGSSDVQTLMGKYPAVVLAMARAQQIPVHLLAGSVSEKAQLLQAGFASVNVINPPTLSQAEAMRSDMARRNIQETVRHIIVNNKHIIS